MGLFCNHCTIFETRSQPVLTVIWLPLTFKMWIFWVTSFFLHLFISMCAIDLIFLSRWSTSSQNSFKYISCADIWYTFTDEILKIKTCLKNWFKTQKFLPKKESFGTWHKKCYDCPEKKLAGRSFCRMTTKIFLGLL